ncbi:hypothetical protein A9Q84_09660 [Halobacteriovorax marinus]|uniref:Hydrolase n=1 Tax=Halobacteriovorax marinus TaxID=97084 RepID=A0A1Y5FDB0_9BACT|nr:hypothetical protein A9Q84_09660 [Halobacteriovorax marinus]
MKELRKIPNISDILDLKEIKTVLFDMDGTILDTEILHAKALYNTLNKINPSLKLSTNDLLETFCGKSDTEVFEEVDLGESINVEQFLEIKNEKFIETLDEHGKILSQEMEELLTSLKEKGYKLALVTASERDVTKELIKRERLDRFFDTVLTRNDLTLTKPHPLPYLKAMELLDSKKENTLIFEDSETGLMAAKASGAKFFKANWFSNV